MPSTPAAPTRIPPSTPRLRFWWWRFRILRAAHSLARAEKAGRSMREAALQVEALLDEVARWPSAWPEDLALAEQGRRLIAHLVKP